MMFTLFILALIALSVSAKFADRVDQLFDNFVTKHGRNYATPAEAARRKQIFTESMRRVDRLNDLNGLPAFGVTKFSDWTREEFKTLLGAKSKNAPAPKKAVEVRHPSQAKAFGRPEATAFDPVVNWLKAGAVTPVKNQGQCGSCWAFSTAETVESQWVMQGNALWEFSPQQVASCTPQSSGCMGCGGGWTTAAYEYIEGVVGLGSNWYAPYMQSMFKSCSKPSCTYSCSNYNMSALQQYGPLTGPYAAVSGWSYATPACPVNGACNGQNMTLLQQNIQVYGPASVIVDASTWGDYTGGVLTQAACGGYGYNDLDHAVQLVGYNAKSSTPYWLVRNSWATNWGLNGYIRLQYPQNTCGVGNLATFVTISNSQSDFTI